MAEICVIIPIYKTERYLEKCIESVVTQSYSDIEIILVDDGSPDRCPLICDEWKERDSRIKVIHKENGGLSSAIKAGIKCASAEYCAFVDSDDWMQNDLLESMYYALKKYDVDGVRGGYSVYRGKDIVLDSLSEERRLNKKQIEQILENFYEKSGNIKENWSNSRCSKLYKTEILKKIENYYSNNVAMGEDLELNLLYLEECNSIYLLKNHYKYCIRRHDDSMTGSYYPKLPQLHMDFICDMYRLAERKQRPGKAIVKLEDEIFFDMILSRLHDDSSYFEKKISMHQIRTALKEGHREIKGKYPKRTKIVLCLWVEIFGLYWLGKKGYGEKIKKVFKK